MIWCVPAIPNGDWKNVSGKRSHEIMTNMEKQKCEHCEKDAIGFQSFGCCCDYVCEDHADSLLLRLKPGEKQTSGECYFERYGPADR